MIKKIFFYILSFGIFFGCNDTNKEEADLLVINANVYTVDDEFSTAEAFVVKDGKFLAVGTSKELQEKYNSAEVVDAQGKTILPGLIDAHAHFYGLGSTMQTVNLTGTNSFEEVVARITEFQKEKNTDFIVGRGWDQNDWEVKEFPVKDTLDVLFPDTPVAITRIDGHALLANQAALDAAGITTNTPAEGGEIEKKNGELTGILIDNPMALVENAVPQTSLEDQAAALLDAQKEVFQYGLTTVNDAGLDRFTIELIDSLQQAGELDVRIYAMISNTKENLDYFLDREPLKTEKLNVRAVKFYADGALGSRGAALKQPYSDKHNHFGALLSSVADFKATAARIAGSEYQMNTHAIGDSANVVVLKTYDSLLADAGDRRWKVEHSQVIAPEDFKYFSKNIIPSVQPTHATSDMYWAQERLGPEREKGAYAYKKLLDEAGIIALGTDFPVEQVSPFLTFYAAVARKDTKNYPEGGYMSEQALTREEALRGMTIWAAYSNFEEDEKGSIEPGKFADFVILDRDIMKVSEEQIPDMKASATYLGGKKVY
ncbi:amidohydrolase [Salinimicrobium sediminilitoris]|uniref:amidohydrolase n=1 Tax=Salinimicrobium sediminilitoris TaxID=2876715 RepID=UPI001E2C2299|nr:amidohydrolase [Salinimicrobium sediminilitoris]MCC8360573.1 amidohydrolase [Salinimicrobium sediminilitoris]